MVFDDQRLPSRLFDDQRLPGRPSQGQQGFSSQALDDVSDGIESGSNTSESDTSRNTSVSTELPSIVSLELVGPPLDRAKSYVLDLYRRELPATRPNDSARSHGARLGWAKRDLAKRDWNSTKWVAGRLLSNSRLHDWLGFVQEEGHAPRDERLGRWSSTDHEIYVLLPSRGLYQLGTLNVTPRDPADPLRLCLSLHNLTPLPSQPQHDTAGVLAGLAMMPAAGGWRQGAPQGFGTEVSYDKHGGILVLARTEVFTNMAFQEVYPGRLVHFRATHIRTHMTVDVIGLYQHVWRSQLPAEQNHIYRKDIWDKLSSLLLSIPTRHVVMVAGDYNSVLQPLPPHVGPAATAKAGSATTDKSLGQTQIDFVMARIRDSKGLAKMARPQHSFPVGAWRKDGHWPVEACLPVTPFHRRPQASRPVAAAYDTKALQLAVITQSPEAEALRLDVEGRLPGLQATSLLGVRNGVNQVMLDALSRHFPLRPRPDTRISAQGPYRASARETWRLYRVYKAPRIAYGLRVWRKWFDYARFRRASAALRAQSQQLKRSALLSKLEEAEQAAVAGNQRVLHQIVRSLAPSSFQIVSRLRSPSGALQSKADELQQILQHAKAVFAKHSDHSEISCLHQDFHITDAEVQAELRKLGVAKAVPKTVAPAACWKLCSSGLSQALGPALRTHFRAGSVCRLQQELHDAHVSLIPKPNKPATEVANLRPIGLQCPSAKVVAGLVRQKLLDVLTPLLQFQPQYAYTKCRGTFNAILRVHGHFEQVGQLLRANRLDRFQQHQGSQRLPFFGGLSLSLDLTKAFDLTDRPRLYGTLSEFGVSQDVISIVQQLYKDARYIFRAGSLEHALVTTNGLKQGCLIAPFLWCYYTLALLHTLQAKRDGDWARRVITLFADDTWGSWVLKCKEDFYRALDDLTIILETLVEYKMEINYKKTAILLRIEGKQAKAILHEHCCLKNGQRFLKVVVHGQIELIPIKDSHEYLGTQVSYRHRLDKNLNSRVQAGQAKHQQLKKVLNGTHVLSSHHRVRLWAACVQTSLVYSLPAVGVTKIGLQKLEKVMVRHLRAIFRQPAHLTHSTNASIWERARQVPAGRLLLGAVENFTAKLQAKRLEAPDITTEQAVFDQLDSLIASLRRLVDECSQTTQQSTEDATLDHLCPECAMPFSSDNARRIHCKLKHGYLPEHATSKPVKFQAHLHACGGLPQCQLCNRRFGRWQQLRRHIEDGSCHVLGGESLTKHPINTQDAQVASTDDTAAIDPATATGVHQNMPLVRRHDFLSRLHDWEALLRDHRSVNDLAELNPEAEIFAHCHPSLLSFHSQAETPTKDQPSKRPRQEDSTQKPGNQVLQKQQGNRPTGNLMESLKLLARLLVQHEDQLAALRMDKGFVLFARQDQFSLIPAMYAISKEWNHTRETEPEKLQSPLRTLLLACLIRELMQRIQKMVATTEGMDKLKAASWMTAGGEWCFMKFCHRTKKLIPNPAQSAMAHDEVIRLLTFLLTAMQGEIIHKFCSTRPLKQLEGSADQKPQAVFLLEISLRGEKAGEVHEAFSRLANLSVWQLIRVSMKRESLQRSNAAKKVAQLLGQR
ncbi:Pol [Symbiodinium sp. CCMP2592]|nr:Pol [Symbiodinium sp. CCMP2592]